MIRIAGNPGVEGKQKSVRRKMRANRLEHTCRKGRATPLTAIWLSLLLDVLQAESGAVEQPCKAFSIALHNFWRDLASHPLPTPPRATWPTAQ